MSLVGPADPRVFISYRRSDLEGYASLLYRSMAEWFDDGLVFLDQQSIEIGDEFPARLNNAIRQSKAFLALIGPQWESALRDRAAANQVDYVRREIELALELNRTTGSPHIVPILFGGARIPALSDHESLHTLAHLFDFDAHAFSGKSDVWDRQLEILVGRLGEINGLPAPRWRPRSGRPTPYGGPQQLPSAHFSDPLGGIASIEEYFQGSGDEIRSPRFLALVGIGGSGKTELAIHYCQSAHHQYAGVWWFGAQSASQFELDTTRFMQSLGVATGSDTDSGHDTRLWIEAQGNSWLLVYDDANDPAWLTEYLPRRGAHHVILTSQGSVWGNVAGRLAIDPWPVAAGAQFLSQRCPTETPADCTALSEDLGALPLALEQAASYMEATETPIRVYRAMLASIELEGALLDEDHTATRYPRSVASTLSVAFRNLSSSAESLLRLIGFTAPAPIPEGVSRWC